MSFLKKSLGSIAVAGLVASLPLPAFSVPSVDVGASDHIDAPTVAQDRASDIDDTYAFLDPNDNSKVVLMMTTVGFIVSGEHFGMAIFDHNIRYRFEIENTGDAKPDTSIDITYSKGLGRTLTQIATIKLPDGREFTAPTTSSNHESVAPPPVVTTDATSGARFYAGVADDRSSWTTPPRTASSHRQFKTLAIQTR